MKKANEIRAEIAELSAKVQAIVELASTESRELNEDEKQLIDDIQGIDDKPGQIANLQREHERAVRFEARCKELVQNLGPTLGEPRDHEVSAKPVKVPARAKAFATNLKAFSGADAERDAYVSGRWIAANFFRHERSQDWLRDHGIRNAMSESEDDRGGIFVPTEMSTGIIRLVEEYGVFRANAQTEPMGSNSKVVPVRVSGLTATPVGETSRANEGSNGVTAQDVIYTNIELIARKWKIVVKMSDELNEDALISMAEQVANEAALAFAYAEDNAGFNGTGASAFHGIVGVLNAVKAGSVHTAATGNTAFSSLDLLDFISMKNKLPRFAGIMPVWFISPEGYGDSMERLLLAAGGNAVVDIANGGVPRFLGAPVILTNVLNSTLSAQTSTKLLAYGDLRMAARFGDRRQMTMDLTDQRYWDEDQIAIKATERFDINVHSTGTATAPGAILVLQTPGS